ncbi:MAG: (4Fe-4S)-binding protein [Winogradskyella sp.]|nr:(4Fe-4S)-binding protein [Winogradskyella sp.]MBT8376443.1 (4Fe-4S)-binding protein [Bacteroidia bacterium]NNC45306.1 (4Fe-4S)-binding protein [Winogradskyella sp.]NNK39320.1 (4Fe-4S)-binding protein [Winogradskyella sp.]NNL83662.1 (4Fe-4S)-binding protein [Winogradskyella sp.]
METHENVFSNNDITVTYEPRCCVNAELCAKQLSNVFRQSVIPWIHLDGESTDRIIEQVKRCPSGALQFKLNNKNVA